MLFMFTVTEYPDHHWYPIPAG